MEEDREEDRVAGRAAWECAFPAASACGHSGKNASDKGDRFRGFPSGSDHKFGYP